MRALSWLIAFVALSGCGPLVDWGGFSPYPSLPARPAFGATLGLGFASDGSLWLTYPTLVSGSAGTGQTWPARYSGSQWEIGNPYEHGIEAQFMGMHPEGPALRASAVPDCFAARYRANAWVSKPAGLSLSMSPDGRLYTPWEDAATDLHISVYSPDWESLESDSVALAKTEHLGGYPTLAFSPSAEPFIQYVIASSPRTVLGFKRFDGASWVPAAADLDLAVYVPDAGKRFHVDSQGRIWVMPGDAPKAAWRWNGSAWENLGAIATFTPGEPPDGLPPYTQLVTTLDAQDRLVTAWTAWSPSSDVATLSVRRYGSDGWEDVGPSIKQNAYFEAPALAIAPDDRPVVAFITILRGRTGMLGSPWMQVARYTGE